MDPQTEVTATYNQALAGKAYEEDGHAIGDCWQLADFMRKLGLTYPVDDQGQAAGETYTFEVSLGS
jgi:hypothetical protein